MIGRIIKFLGDLLWQKREARPQDVPEKLSPAALSQVQREADFLRGEHAVEVRTLAPGELPSIPKRVKE